MHGHVPRQVVVSVENLSTVRTRVRLVLALHHLHRKSWPYSTMIESIFEALILLFTSVINIVFWVYDLEDSWTNNLCCRVYRFNFGVHAEADSCACASCRKRSPIWWPVPSMSWMREELRCESDNLEWMKIPWGRPRWECWEGKPKTGRSARVKICWFDSCSDEQQERICWFS